MKKIFSPPSRQLAAGCACLALLCSDPGVWITQAQAQNSSGNFKPGEPVTLNFNNAEIEAVARAMASMTGRTVVVDPRVKGTINLSTDTPVSPAVAYNQFLATIRLQGFTVVQSAGLDKVVPEADAKLQGGSVTVGPTGSSNNQITTQIFRLDFENANNLVPVLRPLISPNNTINVNPGTNSLIITDYADNLQRISRIIASLDNASATQFEIITLKHAIASDLVPLLTRLVDTGSAAAAPLQPGSSSRIFLMAEPRSNALILRTASAAQTVLVKTLIQKLDQPSSGGNGVSGNIYVVYLKNADATKLAVTLRAAMTSDNRNTSAAAVPATGAITQNQGAPAQAATGGQIQADPATNSLIITAPEPQYRQLLAVIDKLDARRAQVFVESLIAEVNVNMANEFGVQWQSAIGQAGNASIGLIGTNFSAAVAGSNIISLATQGASGAVAPGSGLNVGVANQTNGVYVLGFLARFLEQSGEGNILSTPNLLTLDNEEAKIVIGQNVPFVTGQYTNSTAVAGGTVNPFQTIERKDVGLTLRVKPQISENGSVKLTIFQEVSSVQASSVNSVSGIITNKRSIESNVLVNDGAIVVLGGLLQDEYDSNQEKIPGLADLPLIGGLFKSEIRARKKTNLMVFLRPVVVRDAATSESLSINRYDQMRGSQLAIQPTPSMVLPGNPTPALPALPMTATQPSTSAPVTPPVSSY
jgi:general secretion pathway protein D